MPKNLAKVQKQIAKKKGAATSSLHENSRDAKRLRRAGARSEKLEKLSTARAMAYQPYQMSNSYLSRNADELATIQSERRPGRPTSTREDTLKQGIDAEDKEYASGFWIPDISDAATVDRLTEWNGEWSSLNNLKFVRVAKDGGKHASSFPPNGNS
ncbi:MAG: hypothetical protein Q9212_001222 [Teloschistes hypoglaucus]